MAAKLPRLQKCKMFLAAKIKANTVNISAGTIDDYNRYIIELVSSNDVRIALYIIDYFFHSKNIISIKQSMGCLVSK